ncbi:hypothetical protein GLP31_05600 [Photobacterium carnosum]|uniref:contractile injection system protein, VgrG/Pvc8 family n=1 Tax=Photobacterium carnosum TaxID=2023717 RepID=UPI001E3CCB19|nr:contractile injection system protein, VgrG/Pvc8 family [Photobacterium carnosum]MCD9551950.1 hypothetical protein [Photobacterium carnosum]
MFHLIGNNADLILDRLKSWRLNDGNGTEGDNVTLVVSSDDVDGLPPKGERYSVRLGDVVRDSFQISKRSVSLYPREITLVLTVAPFSIKDESGYRERKSCSWDKTTVGQVVFDCLTPHGFDVFVHPRLQKIEIEHIDRSDESTPAFMNRLAKSYDAIAKPVEGRFIFVPIGEQRSASGKRIESVTLSLPMVNHPGNSDFVNVSAELDGRQDFNGVKAFYSSTADGSRQQVKVGSKPFKSLGKDKNTKKEAEQACAAELRKMQRQGRKISIEAPPNPTIFAEGLVLLDDTFPRAFKGQCSVDQVSFSGQGLQPNRMSIQATLIGE